MKNTQKDFQFIKTKKNTEKQEIKYKNILIWVKARNLKVNISRWYINNTEKCHMNNINYIDRDYKKTAIKPKKKLMIEPIFTKKWKELLLEIVIKK
jgi:hypothetical protein